jgi:endonuclease/exonuclease/phosphatase family metal-dependent hydrolase
MSWNVHGMRGRDGRSDPERVALVVEEARADVAGLQEVGALGGPGELLDPAGTLSKLTGLAHAFGLTELRGGYPYGNCILSRYPISATRSYDLSVPGREKRGCLRADLDLPDGRSLHLFDLHLGLSGGERRKQAAMLLSADLLRDTALTAPLVVCGDFNLWSPLPGPILRLLRRYLRDAALLVRGRRPTYPSLWPVLRLDRAYVDDGVVVRSCGVVNDPRTRMASDHLPLWVDLEPRGPEQQAVAARKAGA